jgi:hypothetical protein
VTKPLLHFKRWSIEIYIGTREIYIKIGRIKFSIKADNEGPDTEKITKDKRP